jgi:hypothetical protein
MVFTATASTLSVLNMNRRMTFHFGNVSISEGPQILLTLTADVHGQVETGQSMGALAPMWFYKDPDMTMEEGTDVMIEVFETACDRAEQTSETTVFAFWQSLYDAMADWAAHTSHPPLLWNYGVSLIEQAAIDAFCRAVDTPFPSAVHENELGIDLGAIYDDLSGREPTELLPEEPCRSTAVRHTVGLSDPLTVDDIAPDNRLDDGLPQALSEYIEIQGVDHFKVKLAATDADVDRLKRILEVVKNYADYAVTVDANEQYESAGNFRDQWETMQNDPDLTAFLDHVLYVEQPLARDEAFTDETRKVFEAWDDRPPVIIDESDDHVTSLKTALDCGYAGTSHKNCKGVFKGIANRCLLEHYRRNLDQNGTRTYLMSGEDLTTLGPIELQQDLAVMATLGMDHVERNGHHYYRGLSMLPDDVQAAVLDAHGDLYHRHEDGFAALDIQDGQIRLDSVLEAPFGRAINLDPARFTPANEWDIESIYESI